MKIKNIAVHEVRKDEANSVSTIHRRKSENKIDEHAIELSSQLSTLFNKTGLSTGKFTISENEDDPQPHFVTLLQKYYVNDIFTSFITFTRAAALDFQKKLDKAGGSKGGYLWFNHFKHNNEAFLSVVLLRKKHGLAIQDDLTLGEIEEIDLDRLHMAARINLSAWKSNISRRYISFRIGKGASDVTDYFSSFIGCEEYTKAKYDTQNLVEATKRFCTENEFSTEKTEDVKQFLYEQCLAWMKQDEPVLLENISAILDAKYSLEVEKSFLEIAQGDPFYLNNEVPIERSALRKLTRYSFRTKKISLSFDSDLLEETVFYDADNENLVITDLPSELKSQLSKKEES